VRYTEISQAKQTTHDVSMKIMRYSALFAFGTYKACCNLKPQLHYFVFYTTCLDSNELYSVSMCFVYNFSVDLLFYLLWIFWHWQTQKLESASAQAYNEGQQVAFEAKSVLEIMCIFFAKIFFSIFTSCLHATSKKNVAVFDHCIWLKRFDFLLFIFSFIFNAHGHAFWFRQRLL